MKRSFIAIVFMITLMMSNSAKVWAAPEDSEVTNSTILKNPEGGLVVNQPVPSEETRIASQYLNASSAEGLTGNAVPLSSDTISYSNTFNACKQIPCEEQGGIYFLNEEMLSFYSTDDEQSSVVHTFDQLTDVYVANDKLYVLSCNYSNKSAITVYDLMSRTIERTFEFGHNTSVIGADSSGRIYLSGYEDDHYRIYLLSSLGELLSQTISEQSIYSFGGFDSSNGNFYVEGYDNWIYWGYDHDMHALRAGNVSGNTISFNETILSYICQSYFYERQDQVSMLGDRYFCIDSTFQSGLSIWDSDKYDPLNPENTGVEVAFLARDNMESGEFDGTASVGTRAIYCESTDTVISFKNNSSIAEYDLKTGQELFSAKTDYPVFSMMKYKNGIAAIEKSGESFYFEYFPWKYAANVKINGTKTKIDVGETIQLSVVTDGALDEEFTWSSSNPKIASVTQSGQVFGWGEGTAVITVVTSMGLTSEYTITVSRDSSAENPSKNTITTTGTVSSNRSANNYSVWGRVVNSYFEQNADGTFTRVEYCGDKVIAETYSSSGSLIGSKTIQRELSLFGGYYSGSDYNYFVFGETNTEESDNAEVIRIVRYTKEYQKVDFVSIKGANTFIPFEAGSLRMTEANGKLYIYTCHEMYTSQDGYNHQANMTFVINENDMSVEQSYYNVMNLAQAGYVSHSFNQFIQTDGKYVYRVDHGDNYPRAISITRCEVDGDITSVKYIIPISLGNVTGYNETGASIGGFELSSENCIIAGNAVDYKQENIDCNSKRNIFISITGKNLTNPKVVWLTQYDEDERFNVYTPHLTKIGNDQFLVMWEESADYGQEIRTKMVTIDGNGNLTSNIVGTAMPLSDCKPIKCSDGLVRWYTTQDSSPTIYTVNPFGFNSSNMRGDINEDGAVDILDLMMCLNHVAGKTKLEGNAFVAANVNEDDVVNLYDLMKILNYIAKGSAL